MEKKKETADEEPIRNTGDCEEKVNVDGCYDISSSVDQASCSQNASGSRDEQDNDEGKVDLSLLTSAVDTLDISASQTSKQEVSLDERQETKEEEGPEGAVGGSPDLDLETKAAVSNDKKALALNDSASDKDAEDDDGDEDDDGKEKEEEKMKTCFSCGKKKQKMKKCGGCRHATYCDVTCQKADWKKQHKTSCGNYKRFLAQVNQLDMLAYQIQHGPSEFSITMDSIKHPLEDLLESALLFRPFRRKQFVLLEIVDKHPHFFRPGCFAQDVAGKKTQILFYMDHPFVLVEPFPFPLPLERFLQPGKFIWLVDPIWHHFLDGTVGIRINHPNEFELP